MEIKRILAGGLAALMAGATLAFGAFAATTLEDFVTAPTDSTLSSPAIVVGDMTAGALATAASAAAKAEDTIAAADVAAAMMGYATKSGTCAAVSGGMTVSDGVDISTTNTKLYLADGLDTARTTLTKSDMPTILASSKVTVSGTDYKYDQYITLGAKTVTFGKSGQTLEPQLYVDLGTASGTPAYTSMVVFNKPLNVSDATNVQSKTIKVFGGTYTIGSGSGRTAATYGYSPLILFGAGITKTLDEDTPITANIGGTDYTVEATFIASTSTLLKVNEETSSSLAEGASDVVGGLNLYIKDILYSSKTGSVSKVIISLGTEKITLKTATKAKLGQDETSVDNTMVTITGDASGISKLEVAVAAQKANADYIAVGETYTDPVFKTFKVGFGGMNPTPDSTAKDTLEIAPSGDTAATLKMTDYRGHEASIIFAYDNDSATSTAEPRLMDTNQYKYHVMEGEVVPENDYVILAQGDFSHLFQLSDVSDISESTASITLTDKFSGDLITVTMESPGYDNATFYVDGQTYYAYNTTSDNNYVFTWGTGAAANEVGNETTVFPYLRGNLGELVAIIGNTTAVIGLGNASASAAGYPYYDLPGGNGDTGRTVVRINASTGTVTAGQITYAFNINSTKTGADLVNLSASAVDISGYPMILLLEEKGKDATSSRALKRNVVIVKTAASGATSPIKMKIDASSVYYSDTNKQQNHISVANTYIYREMDRYGTYVVSDSYEQGKSTIYYPDTQTLVTVGFGSDPSFSATAAAAGSTYKEAVPITNAVAKFASEILATPTSDLILIGGPCVNTLVAQLLNMSTASGDCYNEFVAAYPTKGVVKVVEDAFVTGKKALIIAGTNAANTRDLADNYVIKGDLDEAA